MNNEVQVRRERVVLPTYEPAAPDRNPMFLEKRVYQGSSGRVYPLPFYNRIAEEPTDRAWDAIYLDNGFVEVILLPEIGGRIHAIRDLGNGYESIYRQFTIKPALVGLAGPWASGGIEFNAPQHHRPSTFMPTEAAIERESDGAVTVWMSEHEPMNRMKVMHGVRLRPGSSLVEIRARLYNRTPYVQTLLWWANVATHVHEAYKSFFPPDARVVADHAKRAMSSYPLCEGHYYGVDYAARGRSGVPEDERPPQFLPAHSGGKGPLYEPNDLSWYANIPVPTSYMCMGTRQDFLGGYDFFKEAGLLLLCDHRIAPGKKQWTWGNHDFGYQWDRNLTDDGGPYIELMLGAFTDNQPDFSFIGPGETKTFSQFLYPYQAIGPVQSANLDAAISLSDDKIGVAVTREIKGRIVARGDGGSPAWDVDLAPSTPFVRQVTGVQEVVLYEGEREILRYRKETGEAAPTLSPATEPPLPEDVETADELYVTGLHLDQYRHATRSPEPYWREALRRDPGDMRCNNALGLWHFQRGEFETARSHFETAISRATSRNPNPRDGEPYYNLGLALRFLGREEEALDAYAKAAWSSAWEEQSCHAMGEIASSRGQWSRALVLLDRAIARNADNLRARCLRAVVRHKLGQEADGDEILALDPLDPWARHLSGESTGLTNSVRLDLVIDYMRAGLFTETLEILRGADRGAFDGTAPMIAYYEAYVQALLGEDPSVAYARAAAADPHYCFPSRLEDIAVLESAPPADARAPYYLGNLFYDRRRHHDAIGRWEQAASLDPNYSVVHRNLGIAYFNVLGNADRARASYERAVTAACADARLWYERDQLLKRIGIPPNERLAELDPRRDLVLTRDDLTIEYCALLNVAGRLREAADILESRRFQPWEGGEGMALGIFSRTQLALGRLAMEANQLEEAKAHFLMALHPPQNIGEARHLLANASDLWLSLGDAEARLGNYEEARRWWRRAAEFAGDFQEMSVRLFSEMTYFQALAQERLGRPDEARIMLEKLQGYATDLKSQPAKIDYFATSLPTMLLFEDDLGKLQKNTARFLLAQAAVGLGRPAEGAELLEAVLQEDPNYALASDMAQLLLKAGRTAAAT